MCTLECVCGECCVSLRGMCTVECVFSAVCIKCKLQCVCVVSGVCEVCVL